MNTKIVYALVSSPSDFYLEQALISVYSLRMYNPNAVVELVVDSITNMNLVGKRAKIRDYVNEVHVVEISEEYNPVQRSRYLKTNLRKFIKGDYLFIDCDTVICGRLDDIDAFKGEIGMVADINGDMLLKDQLVIERCHQAGFMDVEDKPYFNSGVIFSRDTESSHRLYEEWYKLWQLSNENGVSFDQPALCQANQTLNYPIQEMSGVWNCQFKYSKGYKYMKKAKVLHYYSNNGVGKRPYAQDRIFEYIKEKGIIDKVVDNIVRHPDTILYPAMTINDDKAFEYFNSSPIYLYQNVPLAYHFFEGLSNSFMKLYLFCSKIKSRIKL